MAKIKKKYKEDFTVVATAMYRDKRLNLKDRGLLGTMMSLPENWDFSIKGLAAILDDGEKAVRNSLQRLEEFKYLKRRRIYENGKVCDWEYIFSDYPLEDDDPNLDGQYGQIEQFLDDQKVHVDFVQEQKEIQLNTNQENIKKENFNNDENNDSKCKQIEKEILKENQMYKIKNDIFFKDSIFEDFKKEFEEFDKYHIEKKEPTLYKYSDLAMAWVDNCYDYKTAEFVVKAEKVLNDVINSFIKPNERIAITKFTKHDFSTLLGEGTKYFGNSLDSKICDLKSWYAAVIRSKIHQNLN